MGAPTAVHAQRVSRLSSSLALWTVVGSLGSVGLAVIGTSLGAIPEPSATRWWYWVPKGSTVASGLGFYASVILLVAGWVGVGWHARRGELSVRRSWAILAAWGIPLLLGPPLFSRDIYSYIGQGMLAHHGLNPYSVAPSALGHGPLLDSIASVWRETASPYGPLFVVVARVAAAVSGGSLVVQVLVFRVMELVGVVLIMDSLPRLARRLGTDPGLALWLGALSPLALFSFIASGHNDALMVGLLLTGLALALDGRLVTGTILCALAATVKLPAAAAIAFIAVERLMASPPGRRARVVLQTVGVGAVTVAVVTAASGLGWTWLGPTALHVPTELRVLSTPAVSLGNFFYAVLHAVGLPVARGSTVTVTQTICLLVALAGAAWLLLHARTLDMVRMLGLALLLIVAGSPTVWPWYLMWGLAVLAVTQLQRSPVLALVAGLAMLVVGPSGTPLLRGQMYLVIAPLLLAGCLWLAWDRRWLTVASGRAA